MITLIDYDYPLVTVEISTGTYQNIFVYYAYMHDYYSYHGTSNMLLEIVTTTTIPSSTSTSMPQENTIIFAAVVTVSVILFIAISIIIVVAIFWRRRSYKSSHNIAKHPVSTNDEVELQQNECYTKASFDDDNKQQQYVEYKQSICNIMYYINRFLYRVDVYDYAEVNQKQDDVMLQ